MFNLKNLFSHALLALALVSGGAIAGPTYHVSIATNSFSGSGEVELGFNGSSTTDLSTAVISNFSSNFGAVTYLEGTSGSAGLFTMSSPQSWLVRAVGFGGEFSFDVAFDAATAGFDETAFSVSLLQDLSYLAENVVRISMYPGQDPAVSVSDIALVTPVTPGTPGSDVPEPAEWALMITGLGLMGVMRRRRA